MAANYSTGPGSSPSDLLQRIVSWLVAQGWTQDMSQADGSGWRAHLHKSGVYVNLRALSAENVGADYNGYAGVRTGIALYLGTGFSSGAAWDAQAGGPIGDGHSSTVGTFLRLPAGAILNYRAFDDGADNVVIVVEKTGGVFVHLGWGLSLEKIGSWTGGPYFFASCSYWNGATDGLNGDASMSSGAPFAALMKQEASNATLYGTTGYVRVDVDGFTGKWVGIGDNSADYRNGFTGKLGDAGIDYLVYPGTQVTSSIPGYQNLRRCLVSETSEQAQLLPIRVYVERDGGGWSLIGVLPSIYVASAVGQGYNAGTVYTVGPKDFVLFPNFAVWKAA